MKFFIAIITLIVTINAYSDEAAWTKFKNKHSREYLLLEDKFRFQIFQRNLRKIEVHNERYEKGEVGYFLKVTQFTDWTEDEFKSFLARQASSRPSYDNYTLGTYVHDSTVALPESVDWREKNAVTPVKDQGICGSCWSFSSTGALEGQLAIHQNKLISLSEQELIDCSLNYGNHGCGGGFQISAFMYVKENGISSEDEYPYTEKDSGECRQVDKIISKLSGMKKLARSEDALISAIATIGPIAVCADAAEWSSYGGGVFDNPYCGKDIRHAILAVGYTEDYLIIKNSWGLDWGDHGYMKLARGSNLCGINNENSYPIL